MFNYLWVMQGMLPEYLAKQNDVEEIGGREWI